MKDLQGNCGEFGQTFNEILKKIEKILKQILKDTYKIFRNANIYKLALFDKLEDNFAEILRTFLRHFVIRIS